MTRERIAWALVQLIPRWLAKSLMWGSLENVRLPGSWVPYIFGRAVGSMGRRL